MSLDLFKNFVKKYPTLANSVIENKTTWQKLYELYEMYGEESDVWQKYIPSFIKKTTSESSFTDLVNMIKKVDLDSVQKGVNNLQKTIGLLQDIGIGSSSKIPAYEPRPLYKTFDD